MVDGLSGELVGELLRPEVRPVVGDDLVDGYPDGAEPDARPLEEPDEGVGGLVVEGLDIGQAGVVVYGYVQVAVAHPGAALGSPGGGVGPPVGPPPAPGRYLAHLLDVQMHQVARLGALVAAYHPPGGPVDMRQAVQPVAHQHPVHRRRRHPQPGADPRRPPPLLAAQPAHICLNGGLGAPRRPMGPRRPVCQTGFAVGLPALPPLGHRGPRQAHLGGHVGLGHTTLDPLDDQQPPHRGQACINVRHRASLAVWMIDRNHHTGIGGSPHSGANNLRGHYN